MLTGLTRLWIALVVWVVLVVRAFAVRRIRGIFSSEKRHWCADTKIDGTKRFDSDELTYEIFGPRVTVDAFTLYRLKAA
jgi:hypothetical protein